MRVAEGLEWLHIYWIRGSASKHARHRNDVTDPPCSGWQHAFVLPGEKRSTIFCPQTLRAFQVRNDCSELANAAEPKPTRHYGAFTLDRMADMLERHWNNCQRRGWARDYDTCALVMRRLGLPVPEQIMTGGERDDRKRGGKDVGAALLKPVKANSKRGRFLRWFLDDGGSRSVREAMAEFSMTRSNALSYLYMLQKDHGIGYVLTGDTAVVTLPDGCSDPFKEPPTESEGDDDDSWLC